MVREDLDDFYGVSEVALQHIDIPLRWIFGLPSFERGSFLRSQVVCNAGVTAYLLASDFVRLLGRYCFHARKRLLHMLKMFFVCPCHQIFNHASIPFDPASQGSTETVVFAWKVRSTPSYRRLRQEELICNVFVLAA